MRLALAAAALATGVLLAPARASAAPVLEQPLEPCYVSADATQREHVIVRAAGFTPGALVDVRLDGRPQEGAAAVADGTGRVQGEVEAPFQAAGERTFRLELTERDNPANAVAATSRVTALTVSITPHRARPSARVRFRGRGFREPGPVYAHYLYGDRHRRTVRLGRSHGACGAFSARARQIPVRRPRTGLWTVQVDQARTYAREPRPVQVRLAIEVRRTLRAAG